MEYLMWRYLTPTWLYPAAYQYIIFGIHPMRLTKIPANDRMYVNRFPYCIAKGCQNSKPHPANKNKYPVPSFRVSTDRPVSSDSCVRTE